MMLNPDHPTAVLRKAWRHVRLDEIRAAARATIVELEAGAQVSPPDAPDAPGKTVVSAIDGHLDGYVPGAPTATARALWTCCNEVRVEAGLAEVAAGGDVPVVGVDPAWESQYQSELDRYRTLAGQALMRRLDPPT